MTPAQRIEWIEQHMRQIEPYVDILNRYFVDDYADATGARIVPMIIGANGCPQLQRDLRAGYKLGKFKRHAAGIQGCGYGFPKWVYVYSLVEKA